MAKKKENYLDFVPAVNGQNTWDRGEDGVVTIHMVNRGFYNTLAQKLFHTPRVSHIKLDEYGSFLWTRIDGVKTVGQLALELKENYTIVMVTHNRQQAARISDKTAFFLLGELVEFGDTERLFSMPTDKRTEDYITGRFG